MLGSEKFFLPEFKTLLTNRVIPVHKLQIKIASPNNPSLSASPTPAVSRQKAATSGFIFLLCTTSDVCPARSRSCLRTRTEQRRATLTPHAQRFAWRRHIGDLGGRDAAQEHGAARRDAGGRSRGRCGVGALGDAAQPRWR